jgi:galactokinase
MTGAGFGGCAVALVRAEVADTFAANVASCYRRATDIAPSIYVCAAADGATVVTGP